MSNEFTHRWYRIPHWHWSMRSGSIPIGMGRGYRNSFFSLMDVFIIGYLSPLVIYLHWLSVSIGYLSPLVISFGSLLWLSTLVISFGYLIWLSYLVILFGYLHWFSHFTGLSPFHWFLSIGLSPFHWFLSIGLSSLVILSVCDYLLFVSLGYH